MAFHTEPIELLTKDEILAAPDIEEVDVPVPQWGRTKEGKPKGVRIRTFSMREVKAMMKRATTKDRFGKDNVDADMLEALMFTEGVISPKFTLEDYDALQEKSAVTIALIMKAINDASGLSELSAREATKSVAGRSDAANGISFSARVTDDSGSTAADDVEQGIRLLDSALPTRGA